MGSSNSYRHQLVLWCSWQHTQNLGRIFFDRLNDDTSIHMQMDSYRNIRVNIGKRDIGVQTLPTIFDTELSVQQSLYKHFRSTALKMSLSPQTHDQIMRVLLTMTWLCGFNLAQPVMQL
ncbi:hypothetical protein CtesDRAFT_PD3436 [Comamonas testosteroni KF-1]|uniref:Uncharacterized protein n=1 Tax=Comamonas testosteroni (strain DSM 14576 / KF-1) TaxID=399795 RepID=B7X2T6_COMTK|nr:hypothetical protein CtesDRAFT_PD3436 [Comamonas testosteroni KF-1]